MQALAASLVTPLVMCSECLYTVLLLPPRTAGAGVSTAVFVVELARRKRLEPYGDGVAEAGVPGAASADCAVRAVGAAGGAAGVLVSGECDMPEAASLGMACAALCGGGPGSSMTGGAASESGAHSAACGPASSVVDGPASESGALSAALSCRAGAVSGGGCSGVVASPAGAAGVVVQDAGSVWWAGAVPDGGGPRRPA